MKEAQLFTKRPVTISAIQWTGDNLAYVIFFTDGRLPMRGPDSFAGMKWDEYCDLVERDGLKIFTLEGKMNASIDDWIIKGVQGEFYPCKPDIFEKTYCAPAQPLPAQAMSNQPAVTDAEVHSFMSQLTIPGEYFGMMAPAYKSALEAFTQSRAIAQPVPLASYPQGLIETLREAAEIISAIDPKHAPENIRWPISDELDGFSFMVAQTVPLKEAKS